MVTGRRLSQSCSWAGMLSEHTGRSRTRGRRTWSQA